MGSDSNGLTQSPFADAVVPTPSASEGDQGIGGGFDADPGPDGGIQHPWKNPPAPTPSGETTGGVLPSVAKYSSVGGKTFKGESFADDITPTQNRTVDRK